MIKLLKYASENNICKIKLSVDKNNLPAISLYKKHGFKLIYDSVTILYFETEISNK